MEKFIEILPIVLLGIGQFGLALVCMNQTRRINELEIFTSMVIPWEGNYGNQE